MTKNTPPDDLEGKIRWILTRAGRPTTDKDLLKQLRVKGEARIKAKKFIGELIAEGKLAQTRTGRIGLPEKMDLVRGRLETKRGGFGFVISQVAGFPDIYVAGPNLGEAMNGDRVLVHIERRDKEGKPEGRIVDVLERRTNRIVGRFAKDAVGTRVVPFDPRLLHEVFLSSNDFMGAEPDDMVVVEITRFPTPYRAPLGRIVEVLGKVEEPGVDLEVVIAKYGLPDAFPDEVVAAAETIPSDAPAPVIAEREDFRGRPIVTIDGETARDFDDAVEVELLDSGNYRLGVHIADVSYYVRPGSPMDEEAFTRGTSVYFPERAIPMLPVRLSNGICSLNPGVDRLVQSVRVEVSPAGEVVGSSFHDGVIRSVARMTYTKVRQILVDQDEAVRGDYEALLPHFDRMLELYKILRARRQARGSIDFDRPEAEVVLDDDGRVVDIQASERNVAHRIIEEFMLLANETVAARFRKERAPGIFRVHEEPDEDRVARFEGLLAGLGYRLRSGSEPLRPKVFQRLLARLKGEPEERLISHLMLRTMKQAVYSADPHGHYALATKDYTHFTSPIRRYPDLVVHRILRGLRSETGKLVEREERLPAIAEHSSIMERRAAEAERELVEWKKVRFMTDKVGAVFDGFVSGVTSYGFYVELDDYFIEGLVHMSTLVDDYYHYHEDSLTLRGESTGRVFRIGDAVSVQLVRVSLTDRNMEFAIEGLEPRPKRSGSARGGRSPKKVKARSGRKRRR